MLKYGGAKALTKHDDLLKCRIDENFDTAKLEITPQLIDNTLQLCVQDCALFEPSEITAAVSPKKHVMKTRPTKKTLLEKATHHLYDLENCHVAEKTLNIDLELYQMEEY